jgi:signal transduction histidine kinase
LLRVCKPFQDEGYRNQIVSRLRVFPILYVDRFRVQTALFNLVENALEAMDGHGRIIIAAHAACLSMLGTSSRSTPIHEGSTM